MSTRMICETCAAELKLAEDNLSGKCPYCRNTYYFKEEKGEALILALNRARGHRLACDFHEAIKEYKLVLDKFPSDAEAHYGMLLSTYGIEYVQDRRTNRWIPTCHRFVDKDIFKNQNYIAAIANAAEGQRAVYAAEAGTIASLQSRIKAQLDSEALEKDKNKNIIIGVVFVICFWPVSIYFFYKAYQISKELEKL